MARITFREFKKYLESDNFYTDREIRHLFNAVKQMDRESRKWVIEWISNGTYPKKTVEQITVEELVKDFGFKPINAFITINWLKHDPQAAKYFIVHSLGAIAQGNTLRQRVRANASEPTDDTVFAVGLNATMPDPNAVIDDTE